MKSESDNQDSLDTRTRPTSFGWWLSIFILLLVLVGLILPKVGGGDGARPRATLAELRAVVEVCAQTNIIYAGMPLGSNRAFEITPLGVAAKACLGTFVNQTNAQGELLDMWMTPVRIERAKENILIISSAGPNGRFGDEDDLIVKYAAKSLIKQ